MIQWMPVIRTPSGAGKMFLYPVRSYNRHVLYRKCENRFPGDGSYIRYVLITGMFYIGNARTVFQEMVLITGVLISGIHCNIMIST